MDSRTPYIASLTREPFMFYEMKITAGLMAKGMTRDEIIEKVVTENLFQYPTERSLKTRTKACIKRLNNLDEEMLSWFETRPIAAAKQICLYALMKESKLIFEFMVTVIGKKYETKNLSYSKDLVPLFFNRLQEQSEQVAGWSDATIKKLISVVNNILKEVGYVDSFNSKKLNDLLIDHKLKEKIIENGDSVMLSAFNCFEV